MRVEPRKLAVTGLRILLYVEEPAAQFSRCLDACPVVYKNFSAYKTMKRTRCMQVDRSHEMRQYREFRPAPSSTAMSAIAADSVARVGRRRKECLPPAAPTARVQEDEKDEKAEEILSEGYIFPLGSGHQESTEESSGSQLGAVSELTVGEEMVRAVDCFGTQIMRRQSDGRINGTQLLRAAAVSRVEARRALKDLGRRSSAELKVVRSGRSVLRGAWFPPEECKELALKYGLYDRIRSLFEMDAVEGQ